MDPLTRRDLLRLGSCAPVVWALGPLACGVPSTLAVEPVAGRLVVPLADFDRLAEGDPAIYLSGAGLNGPLLLWRDGDSFRTLTATCTHLHCEVRPGDGVVRCPCHGSVFALDGAVLRGPAQRPLTQLPTWVDADAVTIDVSGFGGHP